MKLELNALQLDALKEIGNIGAGNAATSLSKMLEKRIDVRVPYAGLIDIERVPEFLGGSESEVASIMVPVKGAFEACLMLVFHRRDALRLAELLLNAGRGSLKEFDESSRSALKELGNISAGSYLWALSKMIKAELSGSVPEMAADMLQAVLDGVLIPLAEKVEKVVILETEFEVEGEKVRGYYVFLPDPEGLAEMLRRLT